MGLQRPALRCPTGRVGPGGGVDSVWELPSRRQDVGNGWTDRTQNKRQSQKGK